MPQKRVTKAVIAAAGFGTRFLPQTKAMPKEMLPLVDKPIIQHIVEELVDAGIEDIVIVTGYHKRSIEDHFDQLSADLRSNLEQGNKHPLLEQMEHIASLANFAYIRQKGPYGQGTPVLNAAHLIGDEPFIYTFADDFIEARPSRFKQLIAVHEKYGGSVLACIKRDEPEDYSRYGYVSGKEVEDGVIDMDKIVEKPGSAQAAPSNIASVSGYLLDPAIFEYLRQQLDKYEGHKEFLIQDAMQPMIGDGHHFYGCEIKHGTFYDTGNKLEYLKTIVDFALARDDIGQEFAEFLKTKVSS